MKGTLLAIAILLPAVALAEPLDYNYVYLSTNDAEDNDAGGADGETFGGFWEFAETLHLFGSYDDAGAYAGAGDNPSWEYETRTLRAGVGGHYLIGERTMIAPAVAVLYAEREVDAPGWNYPREYDDTGYGVQFDLRHAFTNWFEITAGARYSNVFDEDGTEFVGGLLFHPTNWLAVGALYHDGDNEASTEFTVRWYY